MYGTPPRRVRWHSVPTLDADPQATRRRHRRRSSRGSVGVGLLVAVSMGIGAGGAGYVYGQRATAEELAAQADARVAAIRAEAQARVDSCADAAQAAAQQAQQVGDVAASIGTAAKGSGVLILDPATRGLTRNAEQASDAATVAAEKCR